VGGLAEVVCGFGKQYSYAVPAGRPLAVLLRCALAVDQILRTALVKPAMNSVAKAQLAV
jgi:hypothetical protein